MGTGWWTLGSSSHLYQFSRGVAEGWVPERIGGTGNYISPWGVCSVQLCTQPADSHQPLNERIQKKKYIKGKCTSCRFLSPLPELLSPVLRGEDTPFLFGFPNSGSTLGSHTLVWYWLVPVATISKHGRLLIEKPMFPMRRWCSALACPSEVQTGMCRPHRSLDVSALEHGPDTQRVSSSVKWGEWKDLVTGVLGRLYKEQLRLRCQILHWRPSPATF